MFAVRTTDLEKSVNCGKSSETPKMRNFIVKHIGSIAIFSILLWIGVNLQTLWGPIKRRGFHCEDKSIREPYLKNTITPTELYLIGLYLPLGVMLVNEYVQLRWIRRSANHSDSQEFRGYFSSLWPAIMPFLCGFATERFLKSIAKFSVARLRPHFYTVCRPITLNGVACEDEFSVPFYVSEYKCTAQGNMSESLFKSFPSGHSSLSFYGLMYTAIYLQRFAKTGGAIYGPLVHVMQLLCLILACIVGVSRVLDFRHFWSDVFAGALLGSITAVAFSLYRERYMQHFEQFLQKREKGESQRDLEESSESIVAEEVVRNDKRKADQSTIEIGDA